MNEREESYIHPAFPQPKDNTISLWRYMDFDKFEWLVKNSRLFMPCADRLGDPFEGTTPAGDIEWWLRRVKNANSNEQKRIIEHNRNIISQMAQKFRNHYYVSCWHVNEFENYAMWKCYTKDTNAVAVKTTFKTLRGILHSTVEIGLVRYIDYATGRLPSMNLFEHIMHKDIYYGYENEVRAVAAAFIAHGEWQTHFMQNHFEKENYKGFMVYAPQIDLKKLINAIVMHPEITSKDKENVVSLCSASGLPDPIVSRRKHEPVF
ncbi:MAG: hypothetical protein PHD01_14295 [Geobacteraceae bacterium]|nr:hypothetical protein [Geobacteraceae bacterium]